MKEEKQGGRSPLQSKTTIVHTYKHMLIVVLNTSLVGKNCTEVGDTSSCQLIVNPQT